MINLLVDVLPKIAIILVKQSLTKVYQCIQKMEHPCQKDDLLTHHLSSKMSLVPMTDYTNAFTDVFESLPMLLPRLTVIYLCLYLCFKK